MKAPEEILDKIMVEDEPFLNYINKESKLYDLLVFAIKVSQKEVWNEALEFAMEEAFPACDRHEDYMEEFGYDALNRILKLIK